MTQRRFVLRGVFGSFWGLLFCSLAFTACLKDKTKDEYDNEKVMKDSAKIEDVRGFYRGLLYSKKTGNSLGPVEIEVRPEIMLISGQQQAGISATIRVYRDSEMEIGFPSAFFNLAGMRATNTTTVNVGSEKVIQTSVTLDGSFSGNSFTGQIYVQNQSRFAGVFTVMRDAPLPVDVGTQNPTVEAGTDILPGTQQDFIGYEFPASGPAPVLMEIRANSLTSAEKFVSLLNPVKIVDITVARESIRNTIFGVNWNTDTGEFSGGSKIPGGSISDTFPLNINCSRKALAVGIKGFICSYNGAANSNGKFESLFEARKPYRGALVSNLTGEVLAPMEIVLATDFSSLAGIPNPNAYLGASAKVKIGTVRPFFVNFPVGAMDRTSGLHTQSLVVPTTGKGQVGLTLSLQVLGKTLQGKLVAQNFEDSSASFTLEQDALPLQAEVKQPNLNRGADMTDILPGATYTYAGEATFLAGNRKIPLQMQLSYSLLGPTNPQEIAIGDEKFKQNQFLANLVSPLRTVDVILTYNGDTNNPFRYGRSVWDTSKGLLLAGNAHNTDEAPLKCTQTEERFVCEYTSPWGPADSYKVTFSPKR